ncbi:MAG TPA: class I SAM-dependent methyltransferase [Mycobacteriales bacterium]
MTATRDQRRTVPAEDGPAGVGGVPGLFEMMLAYKRTALLSTGVELGVFDALGRGPASAAQVADACGLDPRGGRLLLNALAGLGLLTVADGTYALGPAAAAHLVRDRPGYVGDMTRVMSSTWEWDALKSLPDAVRRGGTVLDQHAETPEYQYWQDFAAFAGAVAGPTAERAAAALDAWAGDRPRLRVLDMACGHGLYGFTLARHQPRAEVWSLDWDTVLPVTRKHGERLGVADRAHIIAGDMFTVPLGGPYDVVMITNVLHHFSEDRGVELIRRAAEVTAPGGRIVLVGFTVDEDRPPHLDPEPHLFSILMLIWTFDGEVHSVDAYRRMLAAGGFGPPEVVTVPSLPLRVLIAERLR